MSWEDPLDTCEWCGQDVPPENMREHIEQKHGERR